MNEADRTTQRGDLLDRLRQATLGEYEILSEAGRGGMAVVYLAHDIALDRKVAIKVISPHILWMGDEVRERFKREARVSASLSHPHIIPIYAVKERDDLLFFVMKFVRGRTLGDVMAEVGPLPVSMVHTILTQVGGALASAHRNGVVHRDIKPANIMLDEEGWAVVTDFGIAKVASADGLTQTGSAVGTPSYMSPEQCSALPVTGASDQYALGVVAYEMLAGRKPFEADSPMAVLYKHLNAAAEPLHALLPDCPPAISHAVMRALEKAPEDRWPQLEDMVAALGPVPNQENDRVRTQMLALAKPSSAQAIVERFQTPPRPMPSTHTSPAPVAGPVGPAGSELDPIERPLPDTDAVEAPDPAAKDAPGRPAAEGRRSGGVRGFSPRTLAAAAVLTVAITAIVGWAAWWAGGASGLDPRPSPPDAPPPARDAEASVVALEVLPPVQTLAVGETAGLTATARDGEGNPLELEGIAWTSHDPQVAVVSSDGMVTAIGIGTVDITAATGGAVGTVRLTVVGPEATADPPPLRAAVTSIALTPPTGAIAVGETLRFDAVIRDGEGRPIVDRGIAWASSDQGVARVSASGVVVGVRPGSARITATSEGQVGAVTVTVAPARASSIEVVPARAALEVGASTRLTAAVRDARGDPLGGARPGWRSSDERVARVSATGEVTAVGQGTARVIAASGDATGFAEIVVRAPAPGEPVDPRPAIGSVLTAYARALEQEDLPAARMFYPGMTQAEESRWASFFANVRDLRVTMSLQDVRVEGDRAYADVEMVLTFRDARRREQASPVRMTLQEDGGTWRIVEVN
jgi:serine/threonine protein kinase